MVIRLIYSIRDLVLTALSLINSIGKKRIVYKYDLKRENLIILGNGPSLSQDIGNYKNWIDQGSVLLVVNDFVYSEYYTLIKPANYVLADHRYWTQDNQIANVQLNIRLFEQMAKNTNWCMNFFMPNNAAKNPHVKELFVNHKYINLITFNTHIFKLRTKYFINFNLHYNLTAPTQNVIAAAIFLVINSGYRTIELYGVDHSWTIDLRVDDENRVCQISRHFYDNTDAKKELTVWKKTEKDCFRMHEILDALTNTFYQYEALRQYADTKDVKIYNRTKGSFIDSFDRK